MKKINNSDIETTVLMNASGCKMEIKHIPTGTVVKSEIVDDLRIKWMKIKKGLLKILEEKINDTN